MLEERIDELNEIADIVAEEAEDGKRTYTVDEVQDILGIGRTSTYRLINRGVFRSVRIGKHIRISRKSFDEWLDTQMA